MPDCPSEAQLAALVEGAAGADEAGRIEAHLRVCSHCAEWVSDARANEAALLHFREGEETISTSGRPDSIETNPRVPQDILGRAIPTRLGSIGLGREIGRGGMGIVFKGWDEVLHRDVAVKFLSVPHRPTNNASLETFFRGSRAEATVRHPNIVQVHSAGVAEGVPYIVMDYIQGPSLRDLLKTQGALSEDVAAVLMLEITSAVSALHSHGIIHRDLKPGNILLDQDGHAQVTDFGLAGLIRELRGFAAPAGTPAYMAPEALQGAVAPQSDIYSLGIIYIELLSGRLPHRDRELSMAVALESLSNNTSGVNEVIRRAIHENACLRYKTVDHFERAIRACFSTEFSDSPKRREIVSLMHRQPVEREASANTDQASGSSSSYELLAARAKDKRDKSGQYGGVTALMQDARCKRPLAKDAVLDEVPCANCGYTLRYLSARSSCPECNTPVGKSLDPNRLFFSDPQWLRRVTLGIAVLGWSTLFAVALLFISIRGRDDQRLLLVTLAIFVCGFATGAFLVTLREPMQQCASGEAWRWLTRAVTTLWWLPMLFTFHDAMLLLYVLPMMLMPVYLHRLARRSSNRILKWSSILFPGTVVVPFVAFFARVTPGPVAGALIFVACPGLFVLLMHFYHHELKAVRYRQFPSRCLAQ